MRTISAVTRGDKRKTPVERQYIELTAEEMMSLRPGDHLYYMDDTGRMANVKVNGQVKRWKREPARFELPLKWGMYECWRETRPGRCFHVIE